MVLSSSVFPFVVTFSSESLNSLFFFSFSCSSIECSLSLSSNADSFLSVGESLLFECESLLSPSSDDDSSLTLSFLFLLLSDSLSLSFKMSIILSLSLSFVINLPPLPLLFIFFFFKPVRRVVTVCVLISLRPVPPPRARPLPRVATPFLLTSFFFFVPFLFADCEFSGFIVSICRFGVVGECFLASF